jgi:hypothetical protein
MLPLTQFFIYFIFTSFSSSFFHHFFYFLVNKIIIIIKIKRSKIRLWQGWLRIRFHDLFWFGLYKVISVSLLKSRVWWVNLVNSSFYWLFLLEFFLFHPSIFGWLWIRPHELFWFAFYEVISVLCSGHVFCGLTRINSYCFVVSYF